MVARTGDPQDRRRKTVSLTETGRTALTAAEEAGTHILRQHFGLLGPQQLATLDTLLAHLDTALNGDKTGCHTHGRTPEGGLASSPA
ncbi:MAG: MarR family winged helix-turn-helix transcriptional regulator [Streptomyces sp.]